MNMRVVSAGSGQNVMVSAGISDLLADIDCGAIHRSECSPVHQTVNEWRVRILINLLDISGKLDRLSPVVILHCNHKNCLDFLSAGVQTAERGPERECAQHAEEFVH